MTGPIKDWTILDEAHKISVPTLLINGWKDEAADSCVYPYFKLIPKVRWIQFSVSLSGICFQPKTHEACPGIKPYVAF